jgi:acyl-coenzyme A thioesterase PaaI-like protein
VVLGAAEVKFLKPVKAGETVVAEAKVEEKEGKKNSVTVSVSRGEEIVFEGMFTCFVLEKHVLG